MGRRARKKKVAFLETTLKKPLGPRMAERHMRKWQFWKRVATVILSSAFIFILAIVLKSYNLTPFLKEKSSIIKKSSENPKINTLLFIGAKEENGKEKALGLALIILKEGEEKIAGLSIPENTFVVVPGHGFEKVSVSLESGASTATSTVKNFLGIEVNHFAKLSYADYEKTVSKMLLKEALERADKTNLNRAQYANFSMKFEKVKPADVNLIPLPVRPIIIGEETFFEPEEEEIDRLFALIWGISKEAREGDLKVIVLNGSGVPGAAGDAAERLINNNCKVVETENANNFDYDKTQIIIYKGANKWATRIRKVLGVGLILRKNVPQDLADVTVVVGKDYQVKKEN